MLQAVAWIAAATICRSLRAVAAEQNYKPTRQIEVCETAQSIVRATDSIHALHRRIDALQWLHSFSRTTFAGEQAPNQIPVDGNNAEWTAYGT